jgi:hypothetical protein
MHMDQPFPLDAGPSRVKNAILNEFKGRCPSIRDVAEIPDRYWLSTPAIGSVHLEKICNVIREQPRQACPHRLYGVIPNSWTTLSGSKKRFDGYGTN